jgi:hypothetical protein
VSSNTHFKSRSRYLIQQTFPVLSFSQVNQLVIAVDACIRGTHGRECSLAEVENTVEETFSVRRVEPASRARALAVLLADIAEDRR